MAAQEYFNMSAAAAGHPRLPAARPAPVSQPPMQASTGNPNPPYPLYDGPPPPYSPGGLRPDGPATPLNRPHSAFAPEKQTSQHNRLSQQLPPQHRPIANGTNGHIARPSMSQSQEEYNNQFRPPVRQQHSYPYPPEKQTYPPQGQQPYPPQQQRPSQPYSGAQPVQAPYQGVPQVIPPYQNRHHDKKGNVSFAPERPHRYPSRSRSRSRSHSRDRARPSSRKKSGGLNTFLGAGGGAILGDAIFPGLGTIGGALLGGFGGHEYDKNKKRARSHEVRPRERRHSDEYDDYKSRR